MRKRTLILIVVLCLAGVGSAVLALTYRQWGMGVFPGTVKVVTNLKTPTSEDSVTVGVWADGQRIGDSWTEIQVISGQHTISFESYSTEYETPHEQSVLIRPHQTTTVYVNYLARFGILHVSTRIHDQYFENYSYVSAEVFVDGSSIGFSKLEYPYLEVRFNASESPHVVSFSEIDGCYRPENQTIIIGNADSVGITGMYEKILTSEQRLFVQFRDDMYTYTLDPDSNTDVDSFYQDVLEYRKTAPSFYTLIDLRHQQRVILHIALYVGIYEENQATAAVQLYHDLLPLGINITGKVSAMRYSNESECIIRSMVGFSLNLVRDQESIWKFDETTVENIIDISTVITPSGMGLVFPNTMQVYVQAGMTTPRFEDIYVPPFEEYSESSEGFGWCSCTFWPSNIHEFVNSLRFVQ